MDLALFVDWLTLVGLIAIMLAMGLRVTIAEVMASARQTRLILLALAANFILVPALTFGLLYIFDPHAMVAVGFLMLAVCPGAPVTPPLVAVARGDVPCAVGLMVILAGLSALLSPALLSLLLVPLLPQSGLQFDYLAIVRTLLAVQILPLAVGLGIHHWMPRLSDRIAQPLTQVANVLLLSLIVLVLVREHETLVAIRPRAWFGMLLLLSASLVIGWLCGGPAEATRKALALTTGVRNVAVALVIVSASFPDTPAVTAVVGYALVSILLALGCALVFAAWAGRLMIKS
jgi:BASS family bile acid:Na+ symporter